MTVGADLLGQTYVSALIIFYKELRKYKLASCTLTFNRKYMSIPRRNLVNS